MCITFLDEDVAVVFIAVLEGERQVFLEPAGLRISEQAIRISRDIWLQQADSLLPRSE